MVHLVTSSLYNRNVTLHWMKTLQKHAINNKYDYYENIKIMVSFSDFFL